MIVWLSKVEIVIIVFCDCHLFRKRKTKGQRQRQKTQARQTAMHACEMSGNDELLLLEG